MNNKEIRAAISNAKLKYWQVAEALSMSDGAFSRKLRKEFSPEEKEQLGDMLKRVMERALAATGREQGEGI